MLNMMKRPKRQLKVSNPFDTAGKQQQTNSQQDSLKVPQGDMAKLALDDHQHAQQTSKEQLIANIDQGAPIQLTVQSNLVQPQQLLQHSVVKTKERDQIVNTSHLNATGEDSKKKTKFESLRQKYLKKSSDTINKPISEISPTTQSEVKEQIKLSEAPKTHIQAAKTIIHQQPKLVDSKPIPAIELPVKSADQSINLQISQHPAEYKTDFRGILDEIRQEPKARPAIEHIAQREVFDLKAKYQPSLPIRQAQANINAPEPPQVLPSFSSQNYVEVKPSITHETNFSKLKSIDQQLLSSPSELIARIHRQGYISEITYEYLSQTVLNTNYKPPQQTAIQYNSQNKSMEPWVRTLFQKFILESQSIPQNNYQTVWEFLVEFFPPLGEHLSMIFTVVMVKLSPEWYRQYEQELVTNSLYYLKIVREHSRFIALPKREEFAAFLIENLHKHLNGDKFCQSFVHLSCEFPSILKDHHLVQFNKFCKRFEWAAIVYLLLSKYTNRPVGKGTLNNLIYIVSSLEEKGLLEQCVAVLDGASTMVGPSAYPVMRELRSKVIAKLEIKETETKKSSKGGIFGFFNQALEKISNSIPGKDESTTPTNASESTRTKAKQSST